MTVLERIAGLWFAVLDRSAAAAADLTARLSTRRRITVREGEEHELVLYREGQTAGPALGRVALQPAGAPTRASRLLRRSHVTLDLDPRHFMFPSIDLPGRAVDFIEPIVRTQIDRLTPWRPAQVLFGWGPPLPKGPDGTVAVTVAATDRLLVMPLIERLERLGAAVIVARVALPEGLAGVPSAGAAPMLVVARITTAALSVVFWRRAIGLATALVVLLVIGASLYGQLAALHLSGEADDLGRQSAEKRALVGQAVSRADPVAARWQFVAGRKAEVPFATLVLEAVSRLLPDNSYVTTFDIKGTRLQLVGYTADAPALIRLFEASDRFTAAAFFAPTTRLPEEVADRFSIEATIRPGAFPR